MSSAKLKKPNKTIWLNVLQRIKTFLVKTFFVARLDDARPTFFLWLPCVWGILLARPSIDKGGVFYMLIFAVMCLMMYSSGCIVNDIIDRDIDRLIPRTANRLLAARQYNLFVAALIAFILAMVSLKILLLFFNGLAITIAITGAAGIIIYPFAKQYTHKTQFVLGFVSNIGVLVAYAGCNNTISIGVVAMYIGSVYWTCVYDTMYGYQDKEHDIKIGVKSLAVLYGSEIKNRL
ncbi:MAG: 4-hydroxybenzoate octaprenyltransferase, partial [Alphaproteobacteria bacterium]|nr:4-hydroxybenzoate octaprenyltransferase [Rickettsiales bacterium]